MIPSTLFVCLLLELFAAQVGLVVPLVMVAGFYFSVVFTWKKSILWQVLFLVLLDSSLSRPFPCSVIAIPLLQAGATIWRYEGNTNGAMPQLVPGFLLGILSVVISWIHLHAMGAGLSFHLALQSIVATTLATPLTIRLLDRIARRFGRRQYANVSRYNLNFRKNNSFDSDYE